MATLPSTNPRAHGRPHVLRRPGQAADAELKKELERERGKSALWRGFFVVLAALFVLGVLTECANKGHRWRNEYERESR